MTARRGALAAVLAALAALAPAASAAELDRDLEAALAAAAPDDRLAVIVRLADRAEVRAPAGGDRRHRRRALVEALHARARASHPPLLRHLEARGATGLASLWTAHAVAASIRPAAVRELARRPEVASIRLDGALVAPAAALGTWNVSAVGAPRVWAGGHVGRGAVIALLDSGADLAHADLAASFRGGPGAWFDPYGEHADPFDATGHGTQALGVAVGGDRAGVSLGVAPGARWIAARIFDDQGRSSYSAVHRAFAWALDPDGAPETDDAPDVVNGSFWIGAQVNACLDEFAEDLALLREAEIAAVFAAGNSGPSPRTSVSPANDPAVISVGALGRTLFPAGFSSRGPSACGGAPYPTLVAPGTDVLTTDLTFGGAVPDGYASASGTSVAAPHVAGAIALLRGAWPELPVATIRAALVASAIDCGTPGPDPACGAGRVDVARAFHVTARWVGPPR